MNIKKIHTGRFLGGLLLLAYAGFVFITGKFVVDGDGFTFPIHKEADRFGYYLNLVGSVMLGITLFYRSLLFNRSNKEFNDKQPKYLRRRIEEQRKQFSVNFDNLSNVLLVIFLIFVIIMLISKIL